MRDNIKTPLTMEERLSLAERSQASSPEAAAKLVERFSRLHTTALFARNADLERMYDLIGAYWDLPEENPLHYGGFCRSFRMAISNDFEPPADLPQRAAPLRPTLGTQVNNAIVLLGLMLLDHAKGRWRDKAIYHCTRMSLGQYLDAVESLAFPEEDAPPVRRFRIWRDSFLRSHDRSAPLGDALAAILRSYIDGWEEFDHLDHILRCTSALACYLEDVADEEFPEEEAERVRQFREALLYQFGPGLDGWYLVEAGKRYLDPGGENTPPGAIRSEIYFPRRDYDPWALQALADLAPSPDLGALLKKYSDPERLTAAMTKIDMAVSELYMLWVEPYLRMDERCREGGPEQEGPLG